LTLSPHQIILTRMDISARGTKEHLLAGHVAEQLVQGGLARHKQKHEQLGAKIESLLMAEAQKELQVDAEANSLLDKYAKEMGAGQVDNHKMFLMIKKKLVRDRNLILQSDPTLSPEDKVSHLSHIIQEGIMRDSDIETKGDRIVILQAIKKIITHQVEREKEVRDLVRSRLATTKVLEGSEEWELLYQKTFAEIAKRRGVS